MPNLSFTSSFKKNTGLLLSAKELRENYLYNIHLNNNILDNLSDDAINFHIADAQEQIENFLNIKLKKQIYVDNLHFLNDEWRTWGYMVTTYPVSCALSLEGFLNTTKQVTYPREWLTVKKNGDEKLNHRALYIVPAGSTTSISSSVIFAGIVPQLGYLGSRSIPYYWTAVYTTGFDVIPQDILGAIGKLASIPLLLQAGENALGRPGLTSTSISIDGLSQSIASQPGVYGARVKAYMEDLNNRILPQMKSVYKGIIFGSC